MPSRPSVEGLEITPRGDGSSLRLRVKAGARTSALGTAHGGALRVSVNAAPERGRANTAVLRLLADQLEVRLSALEWIAGQSSREKLVWIPLPPRELRSRLARVLDR